MRNRSTLPRAQAGFTLIELIIVIVVIGILAAVAIPRLSGMTDEAQAAKNTAILGALKSAWTIAYANKSGASPDVADVIAQMADPVCTADTAAPTTTIVCPGSTVKYTYTLGQTPAIVCTATGTAPFTGKCK
jgi:prepilin-type N-terminal cleavage/methylation domain-containing protein